ncbi:hypothetical protein ACWGGS_31065 [Streptomyces decoyicus]
MKQPFILIHPSTLWVLLAVGVLAVAVAVLSSVLPYTFHLEALRRVPPRVFGILTSLSPPSELSSASSSSASTSASRSGPG